MGLLVPLSVSISALFLLIYFIYSLTVIKKMKDNVNNGTCCTVNISTLNSNYIGAIGGIIISFFILVQSSMSLYSTAKDSGHIDKIRSRFNRRSYEDV